MSYNVNAIKCQCHGNAFPHVQPKAYPSSRLRYCRINIMLIRLITPASVVILLLTCIPLSTTSPLSPNSVTFDSPHRIRSPPIQPHLLLNPFTNHDSLSPADTSSKDDIKLSQRNADHLDHPSQRGETDDDEDDDDDDDNADDENEENNEENNQTDQTSETDATTDEQNQNTVDNNDPTSQSQEDTNTTDNNTPPDGDDTSNDDPNEDDDDDDDNENDGDGEGDGDNNSGDENDKQDESQDPLMQGQSANETTSSSSNETSSDSTETTDSTGTGTTGAFALFELLQMKDSEKESDSGYELVSIFKNMTFTGPFAGSPTTSDMSTLEVADNTSWYEDTEIQDRISFGFRYDLEIESAYAITKPVVYVPTDAGVEPVVEFQIHEDSGTGSFTIYYNCVMGKPGAVPIGLSMDITKDTKFETGWIKHCGQGRFEYLNFGFFDHKSELVLFNADGTYGTEEHKKLEVGPMDASTDLKAVLKEPASILNFLAPYVMSDSPDVSVKLRSTVSAGKFTNDAETTFTVLYVCDGKSAGNVKFTVGIPPWDNVTATWRKDCGGSMSQALLIGTEGSGSFDVMQEGQLKSEFTVSPTDTLDTVDARVKVFLPDVHSQEFFIKNSDDTSDIHFQKVSITLSDPSVMKVVVGSDQWGGLASTGGILQRGDVKKLNLFFMCKGIGKTVVLVTLPTVRYQNVEFGFVKECSGAPKSYHHGGFMQTAGSLLDVLLVVGIGGGIALLIYVIRKKRADGQKYSAVSTSAT